MITFAIMRINQEILRLALPAIITNITVPLLGLIDITIAGHMGNAVFIGAIAVGAMMFNLVYWNFAFLRMGTTGLTAQAFGRKDSKATSSILLQSVALGLVIGVTIIATQYLLQLLALSIISPSNEVASLAQKYFYICVWGAPAILTTMAIKGWMLGMQNSKFPMYISISVNIINIIASVTAVFALDLGFIGIAIGTVTAEYCGVLLSLFILKRNFKTDIKSIYWRDFFKGKDIHEFFNVNRDIFIRSLCLMSVTLFFMAIGARSSDMVLAVNALIMQLFILFSYFMDGFAFAGEALVGRFKGAQNHFETKLTIKYLFRWGIAITAIFTIVYGLFAEPIFKILTSDSAVIELALKYTFWVILIPIASVSAFIWDGVFIGLTATRQMVESIAIATATFFLIFYSPIKCETNDKLWIAFISYLAIRSISQWLIYHLKIKNIK